jgi:hypothetical protein
VFRGRKVGDRGRMKGWKGSRDRSAGSQRRMQGWIGCKGKRRGRQRQDLRMERKQMQEAEAEWKGGMHMQYGRKAE